jgi:two-component system, NarL family, sensor histidine kinase DegS
VEFSRTEPATDNPAEEQGPIDDLVSELQAESEQLARELEEIELLLQQARTEAERHESRRVQAAERLTALDADSRVTPTDLREARDQLLTQARRAVLMQAQIEVLEGKHRALQRFARHVEAMLPRVTGLTADPSGSVPVPASGPRAILAAQEEMRREISRRMHDGPAQSIANISLQAQVVQRLFSRDPERAEAELAQLTAMVEHALEATTNFIFEVRPMVLDDLGLVPTLRRACIELTRRAEIPVAFESTGTDRRLDPELETSVFRIIDEALGGFIQSLPAGVVVRLDWTADALRASVESQTAEAEAAPQARRPKGLERVTGPVPPALAQMIREREDRQPSLEAARLHPGSLPAKVWTDIQARASAVGISVELRNENRLLEARLSTTS